MNNPLIYTNFDEETRTCAIRGGDVPEQLIIYEDICNHEDLYIYKIAAIEPYGFEGCAQLKTLELPNTLRHIGTAALKDCINLRYIFFDGTELEWNTIEKEEGWDENCDFIVIYKEE